MENAEKGIAKEEERGEEDEWSDLESGDDVMDVVGEKEEEEKEGESSMVDDAKKGNDDAEEASSALQIDLEASQRKATRKKRGAAKKTPALKVKGAKKGTRKSLFKKRKNATFNAGTSGADDSVNSGSGNSSSRRRRKRKKRMRTSDVKVPEEVSSMDTSSFEDAIEKEAKKLNWNRAQVKTCIRRLVETPELLSVVLSKAGELPKQDEEGGGQKSSGLPSVTDLAQLKITRTAAKNLKEDGCPLPWVLEKLEKTPVKKNKRRGRKRVVKKVRKVGPDGVATEEEVEEEEEETESEEIPFAAAQLPDDEEEDDTEYDPTADPEADEEEDDADSIATSSVAGSAVTPGGGTPGAATPSADGSQILMTPKETDETGVFKHPSSSKTSQIGGSNADKTHASRMLNFDEPSTSSLGGEAHVITTRSKSSLKDKSIEELETQFVPPDVPKDLLPDPDDIAVDLDYFNFLQETFYKSHQQATTTTASVASSSEQANPVPSSSSSAAAASSSSVRMTPVGPGDGSGSAREADNTDNDPDWAFLEDMETVDDAEFKFDRTTRVPRNELDYLIHDTIKAFELDQDAKHGRRRKAKAQKLLKDFHEKELSTPPNSPRQPQAEEGGTSTAAALAANLEEGMALTPEQTATISLQLKQHIQLLTQMTILTGSMKQVNEMEELNGKCKKMTTEIVAGAFNKSVSIFSQDNLMPSMEFIDHWEKSRLPAVSVDKRGKKSHGLSTNLMQTMADSSTFPFPTLLPTQGLDPNPKTVSKTFMPSEDYLVAMGLETYFDSSKSNYRIASHRMARSGLVKKTTEQIVKRIMNKKLRMKGNEEDNPITYYCANKSAPRCRLDYHNFLPMNRPDQLLRDSAPEHLPSNWCSFLNIPVPKKSKKEEEEEAEKNRLPAQAEDPSFGAVFSFNPESGAVEMVQQQQQQRGDGKEGEDGLDMPELNAPVEEDGRGKFPVVAKAESNLPAEEKVERKKTGKSLKRQRERILKKYSPLKKRKGVRQIFPKLPPEAILKPDAPGKNRAILPKPPLVSSDLAAKQNGQLEEEEEQQQPVDLIVQSESRTQVTILDQAMEDCGIFDGAPPPTPGNNSEIIVAAALVAAGPSGTGRNGGVAGAASQRSSNDNNQENVENTNDNDEAAEPSDAAEKAASSSSSAAAAEEAAGTSTQSKRKSKQQKEAEVTLSLLEEEEGEGEDELRERDAADLLRMAERELGPDKYARFLEIMVEHENDGIKGFCELSNLCRGSCALELQEMLLDLLEPGEALELGPDVYRQHCTRRQQKVFFRKLRRFHEGQPPSAHARVLREISQVLLERDLDSATLTNFAARVFKGNQHLHDSFLALIPEAPFPASQLPEPEVVAYEDLVEQNHRAGGEEEARGESAEEGGVAGQDAGDRDAGAGATPAAAKSEQSSLPHPEVIDIEPDAADADYGGENCPCSCHVNVQKAEEGTHCIHCSLTFINGKVYSRDGRTLRPVRVEYPPGARNPFTGTKNKRKRKRAPSTAAATAAVAASTTGTGTTTEEKAATSAATLQASQSSKKVSQ